MRRLVFAGVLISFSALADPISVGLQMVAPSLFSEYSKEDKPKKDVDPIKVIATGVGSTCEESLNNAKTAAIEKAVGVWIHAEANSVNDAYIEKINQYSGGLISSYTILDNNCSNTTIEALVVPRTNKIVSNSSRVDSALTDRLSQKITNDANRNSAIKLVDNRSKAIAADIKSISIDTKSYCIEVELFFQEKWKHDYYDLQKQTGEFNLDSFKEPIIINVIGYSSNKEVFNKKYQLEYDNWILYKINRDGKVTIYPNRTDTIKLTFPVDSSKIVGVDQFKIIIM